MEPTEVTAHFDRDGEANPLSFTWRGSTYTVDSTGRRWQQGGDQHMLVMAPGDETFELVFRPAESRWYLRKIAPPPGFA
jgi:hypothetical protein